VIHKTNNTKVNIIPRGVILLTTILKNRESYVQEKDFDKLRFSNFLNEVVKEAGRSFSEDEVKSLEESLVANILDKDEIEAWKMFDLIIRESNDRITKNTPHFTFLSASAMLRKLYKSASKERGFNYKKGYGDYPTFVRMMTEKGLYSDEILNAYTEEELTLAGTYIDKEKDKKFSYAGLFLLNKNYLFKGYGGETLELPQERFLTTALYLMKNEPVENRMDYVQEAYWVMSNHYVGLATPTLINSAKPMGSLSSCHILTMDDSLKSIMDVEKDIATFSQNGSGIGVHMGNLRANGSWIRGYKGRATGVVHPSRRLSTLAEYVDQLGARKAGIAVYLPLWHGDIFDFLELRLKTGSQEKRAHSIFTAVCINDEFMRRLNDRKHWTIFDPYEAKKKLGIDINFMYDKKKLENGEEPNPIDHEFTYHYRLIEEANLELSKKVQAVEIYKAIYEARKTGGTPYLYFSDTSARMNPNAHCGMPLGSNLCTEIIQNMNADIIKDDKLNEEGYVIQVKLGEGLVTCNLNSLVIHNVFNPEEDVDLERVVDIQFRMLDNVISLNRTPVLQATHTNNLYRAVGAGTLGLATHLADQGIRWESERASEYVDELMSKYVQAGIRASHKLAMEKGSYPLFEGSDWHTGAYFDKRGLDSEEWNKVRELASKGVRNSYMFATAPTGSNSIIMNGSPSLDSPYEVIYQEEKAGMNVTIVPPNFNSKTMWYYKSAFEMDEVWSLRLIATAQRYIDQGISHNMHLHKSVKASELLRLDNYAWENGIKTIYYTYSDTGKDNRSDGCIMCEG
jgi:ribonucleoside-diphosphate reductase alpha chain